MTMDFFSNFYTLSSINENVAFFAHLSPELSLIVGISFYLISFCLYNKNTNNIDLMKFLIFISILTLLCSLSFLFLYDYTYTITICNDLLVINNFIIFIKRLIIILTICIFIIMYDNINKENYLHLELPIFILFSVVGMFFLVSANNLFVLYLALETQSLALYVLCSINRYSNLSIEAGLKYFIFGSFSSCILLFGISLIYGFTGTLDYYQLNTFLTSNFSQNIILYDSMFLGILFSFCCIIVGLLFKLAVFPFHG